MKVVRVIPCLDVREGVVVKGRSFTDLVEIGDPVELARRYEEEGADEIAILSIFASLVPEDKEILVDLVRRISREISTPILAGGGVKSVEDAGRLFEAGADKVSVNTYAVKNPQIISRISRTYGSHSTVIAIDARRTGQGYKVYINGGRVETNLDPVSWALKAEELGAGEVLLTSIDVDGRRAGYDLELISIVSNAINIPVIASGGAGSPEDMVKAVEAGASAVLAASIFHYGIYKVHEVKEYLSKRGVMVRL